MIEYIETQCFRLKHEGKIWTGPGIEPGPAAWQESTLPLFQHSKTHLDMLYLHALSATKAKCAARNHARVVMVRGFHPGRPGSNTGNGTCLSNWDLI